MSYTIYKFMTPIGAFQIGDDIISGGYPAADPTTGVAMVEGEAYGGGYVGEPVSVPFSYLTIIATNVDFSQLESYINYDNLPAPETKPNLATIHCTTVSAPSAQASTANTTTSLAPAASGTSTGNMLLYGLIGIGVVFLVVKATKKAD